ncbi:hypothetical protein D3C87_1737580 [compost metagenome]
MLYFFIFRNVSSIGIPAPIFGHHAPAQPADDTRFTDNPEVDRKFLDLIPQAVLNNPYHPVDVVPVAKIPDV